jgi:hypothetical protein
MMWHTHAAIGASATWLLLPLLSQDLGIIAVVMVCCVVGAMVPDLDAVESKIRHVTLLGIKPLVPVEPSTAVSDIVAHALAKRMGNRDLADPAYDAVDSVAIRCCLVAWLCQRPFWDACTQRRYYLLPTRFLLTTGSVYEEAFFALFTLVIIIRLLERLAI